MQKQNQCVDNIVLKLTDNHAKVFLTKYIVFSLNNIQNIFFGENTQVEILQQLYDLIPTLCNHDLQFLFFALLNIDMLVKDQLCTLERQENRYKLVRFYQDLEKLFVQFLTNSEKSIEWVVTECKHLYLVA